MLWCTILLHADFQPSRWKYRRALSTTGSPLSVLTIDKGIYIHSQPGLADLRVISGQDEIPYVLEKMSGSHRRVDVSSDDLNQGVAANGDLEVTVDTGNDHRHNGIRVATSRTNFRQRVTVSTSDDGKAWTRVRDASIFDFSQDARQVALLDVSYPVSSRRYVRLTIHGWNDPKAISRCWVTLDEDTPAMRDTIALLKADPVLEEKTQSTLFTWDLGVPGIPHDELALEVDTPEFERAAVVEASRDGKEWYALGQGVLSRFRKEQSLTLDFPEDHQQWLRLRIYNRDDKPLIVKSATLSAIRTRLKFKPASGAAYALYYGNADARGPSYDLRDLLAREAPAPEAAISSGQEETNSAFREKPPPTKPWSEQHPGILYVTLAVAVLGMGTVTVRFLKKVGAAKPEPNP